MTILSKRTRHAVYDIHIHLVFITKYRRKVFTDEILSYCEAEMQRIALSLKAELEEFNGEEDHVHLLVSLPPSLSVSRLVNHLKGASSYLIQGEYKEEIGEELWGGELWSSSYYCGTAGGAPLSSLKEYILSRDRPS